MNRYRLNQILEVLLFPVCDPGLAAKDCLYEVYNEYQKFMAVKGYGIPENKERSIQNRNYKNAEKRMLDYLLNKSYGNVKSYDDLKMLCHLYYPMNKINGRTRQFTGRTTKEAVSFYYIQNLASIAKSLLVYRDGIVAIKTWKDYIYSGNDIFDFSTVFNKVEIWNLLERMTVPDIYIAIYAVESGNEIQVLYGQKGSISLADKLLYQKLQKGLAENHIHFNASYSYEVLWLHKMDVAAWLEQADKEDFKIGQGQCRILQAALFRCAAALYIEKYAGQNFCEWVHIYCKGKARIFLEEMYTDGYVELFDASCKNDIAKFYSNIIRDSYIEEYDFLLESIYKDYINLRTSSEIIFLYKAYKYIKSFYQDTGFTYYFVQYLRIKNNYFQQLQEKHEVKGLIHFQRYYNNARNFFITGTRDIKENILEIFRAQNNVNFLRKFETRIAPPVIYEEFADSTYKNCREIILEGFYNQLYKVFYAYRRFILENLMGIQRTRIFLAEEESNILTEGKRKKIFNNSLKQPMNVPVFGIVYHFLKSKHLNDSSGYFCWRNVLEQKYINEEHSIVIRWHMQNISRALSELRSKIPFISEYIVGIDAASEENAMEPWMFAPAYNIMHLERNAKAGFNGYDIQNVQSIRFTYHVGEEFRHIISGLRHIDEVIEEFHYQAGDRLGHALAIGIDIDKWIEENEVVPIPVREYMENLLWVWGKNTCEEVNLPIQLEVLEDKIMNIAEKLYKHPEGITVRMLYQAYKKKFEEHSLEDIKMWAAKIGRRQDTIDNGIDGNCFCYYMDTGSAYTGWTVEMLCLTNYCPVFEEKYNEVYLLQVQKSDAELLKVLQQHLVDKIERLGVFIETNPTSNLTIGDFSQMKEHPLFRLSTIGNGKGNHVQVMVNSDDPAVFHTNVENELAYIYYAAEYQGYSKEQVLGWVDSIRQNGMDGSFILKEKDAERILIEIGKIMDALQDRKGIRN